MEIIQTRLRFMCNNLPGEYTAALTEKTGDSQEYSLAALRPPFELIDYVGCLP